MEHQDLLKILKNRFDKNPNRHKNLNWNTIEEKLKTNQKKLAVLDRMEKTGGEPDVIGYEKETDHYLFVDCSPESPEARRSLCYDKEALIARKANKPKNSAIEMATSIGIELLTEEQYRHLQTLGHFDTKTSTWLKTPNEIRKLGGALFADFRFNHVFVYHNGVQSYYAGRGFRGVLKV
ncbi:DUF4256 domain-containing protein [uncultured Flavobacterium sp.]|uniref:DUF4256 domain-containing protein n=1 Tax=uncultured Flavobacterium sp. TaxID=165435 RepID=UPI0030ED8F13|tara:strand:+ start:37748 stop:38284 length:537 start_codon:yes stop_codon:yes gene_type:complete